MSKQPRLVIDLKTRKVWLDGWRLDLDDEAFAALVVLAKSRKAGEPFVSEADLLERIKAFLAEATPVEKEP